MPIYPVQVPRRRCRSLKESNRAKVRAWNHDAERIQRYLNEQIKTNPAPVQQYLYGLIAIEMQLSEERVRDILGWVDGGHNGITVAKSLGAWNEEFRRDDA